MIRNLYVGVTLGGFLVCTQPHAQAADYDFYSLSETISGAGVSHTTASDHEEQYSALASSGPPGASTVTIASEKCTSNYPGYRKDDYDPASTVEVYSEITWAANGVPQDFQLAVDNEDIYAGNVSAPSYPGGYAATDYYWKGTVACQGFYDEENDGNDTNNLSSGSFSGITGSVFATSLLSGSSYVTVTSTLLNTWGWSGSVANGVSGWASASDQQTGTASGTIVVP